MVQSLPRYIVGWMPRVYGYSPGNPSLSSGSQEARSSFVESRPMGRLDTVENSPARSGRAEMVGPRVSSSQSLRVRPCFFDGGMPVPLAHDRGGHGIAARAALAY